MIYTITFNPAVDYVVTADTFRTVSYTHLTLPTNSRV